MVDSSGGLYAPQAAIDTGAPLQTFGDDTQQSPGRIQYTVKNAQGVSGKIDDYEVMRQLASAGMSPAGLSPDAKLVSFNDKHGQYQAPIEQVLGHLGWQVTDKNILDADYDHVSPSLRYAIEQPMLANDEAAKKRYLEGYLMKQGIQHPMVEGSGSDWHVFDPAHGKYFALTNAPGMDWSDLGMIGAKAPGVLGSAAGMTFGAGGGPAAPATMMAGAAAGGMAGDAASTALGMFLDPDFAQAVQSRSGVDMLKDVGGSAATNALAGLGGYGLGKLGQAAGFGGYAPLSSAAKGVGATAEAAGNLADKVGGWAATSPNVRDAAMGFAGVPGMGGEGFGAEMAGDVPGGLAKAVDWMRQVPTRAADATAKAATGIGEHPLMNQYSDEGAASLRELGRKQATRAAGLSEEANARLPLYKKGLSGERQGRRIAEGLGGGPKMADFAGNLGQTAENIGRVGKAVQAPARAAWQVGTRGLQGAGKVAEHGGAALRSAGTMASPYEAGLTSRLGAEEIYQRILKRQRALQAQGYQSKLVPEDPTQLVSEP